MLPRKAIQSEEKTARFISLVAILRAPDKALSVHTCHRQRWWISLQQRWNKASVNSFLHRPEGTTGLIRRQPKGKWLLW